VHHSTHRVDSTAAVAHGIADVSRDRPARSESRDYRAGARWPLPDGLIVVEGAIMAVVMVRRACSARPPINARSAGMARCWRRWQPRGQARTERGTPKSGAVVFADDAGAESAQSVPTNHRGPWLWRARAAEIRGGATRRRRGHRSCCRRFRTRRSESRSSRSSGPRRHGRWRTTGTNCRRSRSTVDSSRSRHESRRCGGRVAP
jgi:hypothetical protein